MIISASRRTDIPNYYAPWFFHRIREGYALVRNPMRLHQVSRIDLRPEAVDGIVFWTKNPLPMQRGLQLLRQYTYYFQFTLTAYGTDVEPNLPDKSASLIPAFLELAQMLGPERVIWRYDPIFLSETYTYAYHVEAFAALAARLHTFTTTCVISFMDDYRGMAKRMAALRLRPFQPERQAQLAAALAKTARRYDIQLETCAENIDLARYGIQPARCVDNRRFAKLLGRPLPAAKDRNQRPACGCVASVDIGAYHTCRNGCLYCYANHSARLLASRTAAHDPRAPLLIGRLGPDDVVTERQAGAGKAAQLSLPL